MISTELLELLNYWTTKFMMPIGDDNSLRRTVPAATYALIALNIIVFLLEMMGGEEFVVNWAFIPDRFLAHPISNIPTIFTSMFMHAGFAHLFGNMLYLWIFGDNVEDYFGKTKYVVFYVVAGIAATFAQLLVNPTSNIPNVGASGAIAGILGAYILLYPQGKVNVILANRVTQLPALIVIGFWFFLQFVSSIGSLYSTGEEGGGVAYMAHVGGFVTGFLMAVLLKVTSRLNRS